MVVCVWGTHNHVCHNVCVKEGRLAGLAGYFRPHRKTDRQLKNHSVMFVNIYMSRGIPLIIIKLWENCPPTSCNQHMVLKKGEMIVSLTAH